MLSRIRLTNRRPASSMALAMALAAGMAVGATGFSETAYAQKKKDEAKPAAKDYSKDFVATYQPLADRVNAEGADATALKAEVPGLVAVASTADDRFAAGNIVYTIGTRAKDPVLQRQGVTMMLESGKLPPENAGQYNYLAAQLAYNAEDWAAARSYGEAALKAGYTQNEPQLLVAESYFGEQQYANGLKYLTDIINARISAGQEVPREWVRRGLAQAFNNNLGPQAMDYGVMFAQLYPSSESWGDAIAIARNNHKYQNAELLDLLRLSRRVEGLRTENDYIDYIEAADARRLPGEVDSVLKEGTSKGLIKSSNMFAAEARELATRQLVSDKADLPALERDASAANAKLVTVMGAGDAFLSYNQYDKAERFYTQALGMPGVDTATVLTRLGIAQLEQGKTAEAQATFAKVEGTRKPIARLWQVYVDQKGG